MTHDLSKNDYDLVFSKAPRLCVDLLIVPAPGNRVLLGRRNHAPFKGMWALPGGRVRFSESLEEAAARICDAELGLNITKLSQVAVIEFLDEIPLVNKHSVSVVYYAEVAGELKQTEFFSQVSHNRAVDEEQILGQHRELIDGFLRKIDWAYKNA